jgi:hypothetical protein
MSGMHRYNLYAIAWEKVKFTAFHKPGETPSLPGNHRPMILLQTLSKIIE